MAVHYTPQPLAFYPAADRRHMAKKWCAGQRLFDLTVPFVDGSFKTAYFPTFQIKRDHAANTTFQVNLWGRETGTFAGINLGSNISVEPLDDAPVPTFDALVNPFQGATTLSIPAAGLVTQNEHFWLEVVDGSDSYFSEEFVFKKRAATGFPESCGGFGWLRLGWSTAGRTVRDHFSPQGGFSLLIPSELTRPNYVEKIDAETDGLGRERAVFVRLEKEYAFEFFAPEWVVDALRALPVFSNISIETSAGETLTDLHDFSFETEWLAPGCYARLGVKFRAAAILKGAC